MPEKLERCVDDLLDQGKSKDSAWPICVDSTGEKPHKEEELTIEETITKQVLDAKCDGGDCGCNKKKKTF